MDNSPPESGEIIPNCHLQTRSLACFETRSHVVQDSPEQLMSLAHFARAEITGVHQSTWLLTTECLPLTFWSLGQPSRTKQ